MMSIPVPHLSPKLNSLESKLVTSISLNGCLDLATTQLSVRVRNCAQGALGRCVISNNIIRGDIAGDLCIPDANSIDRVLENGALDEDLRGLTRVDACGEDVVVVIWSG